MIRIGGFVPFTTLDFPGQLAAVVFCQGCPWRCVYCHNPHLLPVLPPAPAAWRETLAFLRRRQGLLDAVVFSGGEPTLQQGLLQAVQEVRDMGYRVGLHTAGMYPARLSRLLPWLDWIGLDIKAPTCAYDRITGVRTSAFPAWESLHRIQAAGVQYEVRLTWHPGLLGEHELQVLAEELQARGVERLVVQHCQPRGHARAWPQVTDAGRAQAILARILPSVVVRS